MRIGKEPKLLRGGFGGDIRTLDVSDPVPGRPNTVRVSTQVAVVTPGTDFQSLVFAPPVSRPFDLIAAC